MKKIIKSMVLFSFLLFFQSCKNNKDIRELVINKEYMNNCFNFKIVIYYNSPSEYRDTPLEIGQIRHGCYAAIEEIELYERSLDLFFDTYFPNGIIILNDKSKYEQCMNNISSFCEIINDKNQLLFWIVPQPKNEDYMIINGRLIKNIDEISELLIFQ